ncbi:hypothetical protein [Calothrix sp. NIES-3974]|uniref:hypothetical protein n=1 Tax=Calothrix sp. NIES-3974 TaxID=2005462 RepID=UPI000B61AB7A|nr:hypothetical protein [Calothrix sp. NIES-3974]BAZ07563.1 hypothetical protein NIES3974_42270 [Calothrix sp. NIES-3974]
MNWETGGVGEQLGVWLFQRKLSLDLASTAVDLFCLRSPGYQAGFGRNVYYLQIWDMDKAAVENYVNT